MEGKLFIKENLQRCSSKEEVEKYFGNKVFQTIIPRNIRLSEAPSHALPINLYAPESKGADTYQRLAKELIEINEDGE